MTVGYESLFEVATMAIASHRRGQRFIEFEIEAQARFTKYVHLWDGLIGEVVGRRFAEAATHTNPDLPQQSIVTHFRVRVDATSVIEAARKFLREEPEAVQSRYAGAWDVDGQR